jgi:putative tricarboxylic transport membrane protein
MSEYLKLRTGEKLFCWLLLAFSIVVLVLAYRIAGFSSVVSAGAFPMGIAAVMVLAMGIVVAGMRKQEKPDAEGLFAELRQAAKEIFPPTVLIYAGLIGAYAFAIERLHFMPATFLFLFVSMVFLKGTTVVRSLLITAGTVAAVYGIFLYVFKVVVP